MKTALIVVTLVELGVLVLVLAGYLIAIAATLRTVSRTLGLITFGVRAIEKQTEPLGSLLADVNGALEQVATALGRPPEKLVAERTVEAVEHGPTREVSGGGT
jgi:uncharacterized protein YoxC